MKRYPFFLRYALNGLWHGGQRVLIAILAVAFGVMSLVAMSAIANKINASFNSDPRIALGGDVRLSNFEQAYNPEDLEIFQALQDEGVINAYSPIITSFQILIRTEDSGRASFVSEAIGIDPTVYPLAGDLVLREPDNATTASLLQEVGAVLITDDLADRLGLTIGETIRLAQPTDQLNILNAIVTGILADTPDHIGERIYYSTETAQVFLGDADFAYGVVIATDNQDEVATTLNDSIWRVRTLQNMPNEVEGDLGFFSFMLNGAGILGLIVGGIGIANTMQVLLLRRQQEIGILKSLGYSQSDMLVLFIMEAMVIGFAGSIIGTITALLVSSGLLSILSQFSTFILDATTNWQLILNGIVIGTITAILFAINAIVQASRVRPIVIFRKQLQGNSNWHTTLKSLGFYVLLAIPFAGVTTYITGSVIGGVAILIVATIALIVLSLMLGAIMWFVLRILPVFNFTLLRMARNNLRRRIVSLLFAMIALFVGIFSLGLAITMLQVGFDEFSKRQVEGEQNNLLIYADSANYRNVEATLYDLDANTVNLQYIVPVESVEIQEETRPHNMLEIRDKLWDLELIDGQFSSDSYGVYLWEFDADVDEVTTTLEDGSVHQLPVLGYYHRNNQILGNVTLSPIINQQTAQALNITPSRINIFATTSQQDENQIANQISEMYPQTITLTLSDLVSQINSIFLGLFYFAIAMSALALTAGVVLIANVVSLAMIERRYEIGVLKAVGYTRKQLLTTLALEYGLVGLIASIIGIIGVNIALVFISVAETSNTIDFSMTPLTTGIILLIGMTLTLFAGSSAAWQPTSVRPLVTLNSK
jgi:putative ABC transport system permease protein